MTRRKKDRADHSSDRLKSERRSRESFGKGPSFAGLFDRTAVGQAPSHQGLIQRATTAIQRGRTNHFETGASEMDAIGNGSLPAQERETRKQRLLHGPEEFCSFRSGQPKPVINRRVNVNRKARLRPSTPHARLLMMTRREGRAEWK